MRGFQSTSFDPQTLVVLEAAFDEAWLTLKAIGNTTVSQMSWRAACCALPWRASAIRCVCTTARSRAHPGDLWREAG